jgi:hypothetical protein
MEINLGVEQVIELQAQFTAEQIRDKASARRVDAFGAMAKLLQRPKFEDIDMTAIQKRFEPFWFAAATARFVYDRHRTYHVEVPPEVQAVNLYGSDYPVSGDQSFSVEGLEHCLEEARRELILEAEHGEEADLRRYLKYPTNPIADLSTLSQEGVVVVPPEVRASFVVRKLVSPLLKTFQADAIHEERIDVEQVSLYYRPIYAIEYQWKAKQKTQIWEYDALTGDVKAVTGELKKQVARVLANDALFDIGADAIGMVLPGANIAVKLGRMAARKAVG